MQTQTIAPLQKRVDLIPANILINKPNSRKRKLRVAAYCRVSTEQEEQQSSYAAQIEYYTEKIKGNKDWEFAGIFADAAAIIGLNQKPEANGRRFSPFSLVSAHFKANGGCNCLI